MGRALILDDEADLLLFLSFAMSEAGYEAATVRTVAEAWRVLEEQQIDLVMTDLRLAGEAGWDLIARIRKDPRLSPMPIVVTSAWVGAATEEQCAKLDASYLPKPFSSAELRQAIQTALAYSAARQ